MGARSVNIGDNGDVYITMKRIIIAALTAITLAVPAGATAKTNTTVCEKAYEARQSVVKKHGTNAPGRNICRFGVKSRYNAEWSKDATYAQKKTYLFALRRLITPPPAPTLLVRTAVPPKQPPAGTLSPGVKAPVGGTLSSIAACESGGDPTAVSENGTYRGKYQFDQGTWESVGGTGDPAAAPEGVQDALADKLYQKRGAQPWPVCGK